MISLQSQPTSQLRPVDTRCDLYSIADLIELCFGDQMDPDGHEYVRQIRRAADDARYLRWLAGPGEQVTYPLNGYVWVEKNQVIGNLTLIPSRYKNRWYYLIANVAVHPEFRRRGIARKLTEKALQHAKDHRAYSAWLHVREENFAARELYRSLGMAERASRSTWQSNRDLPITQPAENLAIFHRSKADWNRQNQWLHALYPPEVIWNMPFVQSHFDPGIWASLVRMFNGDQIRHWSAYHNNELVGVVSWEPSRLFADTLWLATPPDWQSQAIHSLLAYLREIFPGGRPMQVNFPAGQAEQAFRLAGFEHLNTLIWMEKEFC